MMTIRAKLIIINKQAEGVFKKEVESEQSNHDQEENRRFKFKVELLDAEE